MENKKVRKISLILSAVILVLIAGAITAVRAFSGETESGKKSIVFEIGYSDNTTESFEIKTDKEYLADALFDEKLVYESEYQNGYYTVINGQKADYNVDKSWWCISKDGEMLNTGMNQTPITDGDKFEAIYTIS